MGRLDPLGQGDPLPRKQATDGLDHEGRAAALVLELVAEVLQTPGRGVRLQGEESLGGQFRPLRNRPTAASQTFAVFSLPLRMFLYQRSNVLVRQQS